MISTPYLKSLLQAHHSQGSSNDCGPFSAAIVLRALQLSALDGSKLGQQMNALRWRGVFPTLQRVPNWATFPWGVVGVLRDFGLRTNWSSFNSDADLLRTLRQHLVPILIIGEWKPIWAHYSILVAYDEKMGWGFIDPAHNRAEVVWKPAPEFERLWKPYGRIMITVYPGSPV